MEYNGIFGPRRKVTIPYSPTFQRTAAHHSNLYQGCSIAALAETGTPFELNTAGWRKECREQYPAREFLELAGDFLFQLYRVHQAGI